MAENGEKRDPSSHRTPGQIKRMNREYDARPEKIKGRAVRNQARRIVEKDLGKKAIEGKDVGHIKPVRHGGGNSRGNLRVESKSANRGWRRNGK